MNTSQTQTATTGVEVRPLPAGDSALIRRAILRAQEGDVDAIQFLYTRYVADVLRYVKSLIGDPYDAEDVTQNVFLKLISVIGKYEQREVPFAAWILRVARNCALDHLRGRRATPTAELRMPSDPGQVGQERRHDIRRALDKLPSEQRNVIVLRHVLGLSPPEIAGVLGKTESSVHGLHHRGRLRLRGALVDLGAIPTVARSS